MKLKTLLAVFCCFLPIYLIGQNLHLIDSLKKALPTAQGQNRVQLLNSLAWQYRLAYPDSAIRFAQEAFALGQKLQAKKELAKSLNFIGVAYKYSGDNRTSLSYHEQAIDVATKTNDSSQLAHAHNSIGRLYFEQGMIQQSVSHYIKAQEIFERINDLSGRAYVYQSLGALYEDQHDFAPAENWFKRALKIREQLGVKRELMAAKDALGKLYQETNQLEESNKYYKQACAIAQTTGDEIELARIEIFIAKNYMIGNKIDSAEYTGVKSFTKISTANNTYLLPRVCVVLGQIYLQQNKQQEASNFLLKGLNAATRIHNAEWARDAYYWLWKLEEKRQHAVEAIQYHNSYLIMQDSTRNRELMRKVDNLQFQLEVEKHERENALFKAAEEKNEALLKQQRLENSMLILAVFASGAIVILLFRKNREKKKINNQLKLRNKQLSDLNSEKDSLMNIVAHDLQNPLNNIKGLSNLMEKENMFNDNQKTYLQLIRKSTQSGLQMITDLLDSHSIESGKSVIVEQIELKDFTLQLLNTFEQTSSTKNISFDIHIDDLTVSTDKTYLSGILNNLISNAIKYSPHGSSINVKIIRIDNAIEITIKDHGLGFSEDDKKYLYQKFKKLSARPTGGETSNGLGLAIVKILVDRLNGEIDLKSEVGQGSEFVISIPDYSWSIKAAQKPKSANRFLAKKKQFDFQS